jgi:hypothetical protein
MNVNWAKNVTCRYQDRLYKNYPDENYLQQQFIIGQEREYLFIDRRSSASRNMATR